MNTLRGALSVLALYVITLIGGLVMLWDEPKLFLGFAGLTFIVFIIGVGAYDLYGIIVKGETRDPC